MVTDLAGNPSPISAASNVVTIDTSTPATLPQPVLLTDTGTSSNDDITDTNNSATTAVATATINSQGMVITIAVTSGGSGYTRRARGHVLGRWRQRGDRPPPS